MDKPHVYYNETFHKESGAIEESSTYDNTVVEEHENNPRNINNNGDGLRQDMTGSDEHEYVSLQKGNGLQWTVTILHTYSYM